MEKRGVLDSENQDPAPEKQAGAPKAGCCGGQPCGSDPVSKMAEATVRGTAANKVVVDESTKQ